MDVGKLKVSKNKDFYNYEQEKHFALDMDFIRSLISKLKHNESGGSDEELRKAFESYTLLTLDYALGAEEPGSAGLSHEHDRLSEILSSRVKRFQKTNMFKVMKFLQRIKDLDCKSNLSLNQIEVLMRRFRST